MSDTLGQSHDKISIHEKMVLIYLKTYSYTIILKIYLESNVVAVV